MFPIPIVPPKDPKEYSLFSGGTSPKATRLLLNINSLARSQGNLVRRKRRRPAWSYKAAKREREIRGSLGEGHPSRD